MVKIKGVIKYFGIMVACAFLTACTTTNSKNTNIYVSNNYGDDNQVYSIDGLATLATEEQVGYRIESCSYIKVGTIIYRVTDSGIEKLYRDKDYINSIVAAGDDYVMYVTYGFETFSYDRKVLKLKVYTFDGQVSEITSEEVAMLVYSRPDQEKVIFTTEGKEGIYCLSCDGRSVECNETNQYIVEHIPGLGFKDKYYISNANDDKQDEFAMNAYGYINPNEAYTSHDHTNTAYKTMVYDDAIIMQHVEFGTNSIDVDLATESHCDTAMWKQDVLEKYDINTGETKDFYSDSNNRILGYNYEENIVYLYSFSKNAIEAKDLDDNSVSTLSSLEKAQTIKFTWCDKTLFWIYENDEVESYGGYLDL